MRMPKLALFLSLFLLLTLTAATHAQATAQLDRVPAHADLTQTTQLGKTLPQWVAASRETGLLPDATPISIQVAIARAPSVQADFEQLLEDQQNPSSPRYHQWLTPQQIGEQYGPTQHDLDALSGWLTAQGLTITEIAPSRVFIRATASAAIVGHAFQTQFRTYTVGTRQRYSIATEPYLPTAFSALIRSISGLNQVEYHPMHHIQPVAALKPDYTTSGGNHYVFPGDFAAIFNLNAVYNAGFTGTGQRIAVIGRSDIVNSDITAFESLSNLASNIPNSVIPPNGVDPSLVQPDEGESDLDLQRVIGVAPGATVDFVHSGTNAQNLDGLDIAINYEINTLRDPVMTLSYGDCEADAGRANTVAWDSEMATAAAEGIAVFVSAGDSGAAGCDTSFTSAPTTQSLSINYLCASSHVTCVGGTEFNDTTSPSTYWSTINSVGEKSAIGYIPEAGWNESTASSVGASGGGVSVYITKPSFQTGTGVPADGFRDVPDVAFPAADHDGYFGCEADIGSGNATGNCANGGGLVFSGTSAAAPGWAGVAVLLNQKLGAAQGNLNPLLYRLAALPSGSPFHDTNLTTAGYTTCSLTTPSTCNNSTPGPTTITGGLAGYAIGPGFDLVTGWGSVDVNALLTAASGQPTLTATSATLTATPTTITTAQTVVFSSTVTSASGTPTGTVQFSSNGTALGSPVALVNGTASTSAQSFSTAGTYTITAAYSGSSTYATSSAPSLNFVVTAAAKTPSTTSITATATTATTTTPVSFTAHVTGSGGTPTGTVQFQLNGTNLGSAVTLASGSATLSNQTLTAGTDLITAVYSGDTTFATSTSSAATITVSTAPAPTLTLSPSPTSLTVPHGSPASDSITLTTTNFSGTESLGCSVTYNGTGTATDLPSCSITNPTLPANGTATATLTVSTTAASFHSTPVAVLRIQTALTGTAFCGLFLLLLPRRKRFGRILVLILATASFAALSGCGSSTGTTVTNPGTTPGSYTITVSATGVVTASTSIALTVQ